MPQVVVGQLEIRPGPVGPEVPQVRADRVRAAVDELGAQGELVKGLVPELPLGLGSRIRSPIPGSGGAMTRALTRSGRSRATAWAIRLPTS
jgi:hypothetical protein